ncbi:MAG: RNA ligase family protein [Bacillota bacterium]|nr:RNA ligase family protein [Bacillota bacterium]
MFEQIIAPMEPQSRAILKEGDLNHYFQVKWDGVRMLAFVDGERLRLQGRSLKNKTSIYPELSVLPDLVKGNRIILDGEIIALHENRPSFYAVMQRERTGFAGISRITTLIPVFYMVFDLLFFDDSWLMDKPWNVRQEMLEKYLKENDHVRLVPSYEDGKILLETVRENKMEGIVAKKTDSPYIPGPRKSSYWYKTKIEQTLEAYVGGISLKNTTPASLLLGMKEEGPEGEIGKMQYIGSVSSGLKTKELAAWYNWGMENRLSSSPFANAPLHPGRNLLYVNPIRKVEVIFNEWTPDLKLRAPRLTSRIEQLIHH